MFSSDSISRYDNLFAGIKLPAVMGIINLTPDSFFDGGRNIKPEKAIAKAEEMLITGADILDMGAMSTRPFAPEIPLDDEWARLEKSLVAIRKMFPDAVISVDTYRSEIARRSVAAGADMINDISGGQFDEKMFETIADLKVPYILMHIKDKPQNMQQNPNYINVVNEVDQFFDNQIEKLKSKWEDAKIILDPGFGFGKTIDHNYFLLGNLIRFKRHGFPVLAGISRKSMIWRTLDITPVEALNGTSALNMLALTNGADVLRVHDVKEAVEVVRLFAAYRNALSSI
jgi:dihydropteroate synthase